MRKYICLLLFYLFTFLPLSAQQGNDSPLRKLQLAEMAIKNFYVDSVNEQKLVEDGIRGMLEKLDPHSTYTDAKETKAMNEPLQGDFEGIGVQFNMIEDTLVVIQPVVNGPSQKGGNPCWRPYRQCERHYYRWCEDGTYRYHEDASW